MTNASPRFADTPEPTPPAGPIHVAEDGRVHGIDGMLDQVASALVKHAVPAVRKDSELHAKVGAAIGETLAKELAPWFALSAVATIVIAGFATVKYFEARHARRRRWRQ